MQPAELFEAEQILEVIEDHRKAQERLESLSRLLVNATIELHRERKETHASVILEYMHNEAPSLEQRFMIRKLLVLG